MVARHRLSRNPWLEGKSTFAQRIARSLACRRWSLSCRRWSLACRLWSLACRLWSLSTGRLSPLFMGHNAGRAIMGSIRANL